MFDLHCHILPGLDDGPETLAESLKMAQAAQEQGITDILATPHHNHKTFMNPKSQVLTAAENFQKELNKQQIPLKIYAGQEIRLTGTLIEDLTQDKLISVGKNKDYLLIELPTTTIPHYTEQLFFELLSLGKTPIIVHPERNLSFQKAPEQLLTFLQLGCLAQLTAPSYLGIYGKKSQKVAKQLLKHHLVQLVSSDAHGQGKRTFYFFVCQIKLDKSSFAT